MRIAVLGLGEAGGLISADLAAAGADVHGYDPRVGPPAGVHDTGSAAEACTGADLVLSLNSAADAPDALAEGLPGCAPGILWADLNTASPGEKQALEQAAAGRVRLVDVAMMSPVPGHGLRVPMTASGPAATAYAEAISPFGATVTVLDGPVGSAATHKLLRSVFYKGLAAAVLEATAAAEAAGLADWLRGNITEELVKADAATLERLLTGSKTHAVRRIHEMAAAERLLDDLGVPPRVTRASRDWLTDLA
ncbi:NAD(P)-dependent oxidoreductase [Paractinoplanes durhamensis]|uniref:3-hydroxyisobutyrate dehydrogenase n=1 Tax=Paractinoplanes durhamensis TaxID=113563 RepID=A0ABQ3Z603_9ACTN|nr:NAD(P)-dependent oxidoreductase [Actinoplanes durhamensis]GIE05253.1 3-hydroxyisobutyrate dehydrogenase [Actinoplanes durhamensis]